MYSIHANKFMQYKKYLWIPVLVVGLVYFKSILIILGALKALEFSKANLLFASDRQKFLSNFLGKPVDKSE